MKSQLDQRIQDAILTWNRTERFVNNYQKTNKDKTLKILRRIFDNSNHRLEHSGLTQTYAKLQKEAIINPHVLFTLLIFSSEKDPVVLAKYETQMGTKLTLTSKSVAQGLIYKHINPLVLLQLLNKHVPDIYKDQGHI